jgi:hypothetical protein
MPVCQSNTQRGRCSLKVRIGGTFCHFHKRNRGLDFLLKWLKEQRSRGKYPVLCGAERKTVRDHLRSVVPDASGRDLMLGDEKLGTVHRTVYGDNGAYHELLEVNRPLLHMEKRQRFRVKLSQLPKARVKYLWWTGPGGEKVYEQTGEVRYADYRVGRFYVSPDACNVVDRTRPTGCASFAGSANGGLRR